MRAKPDIHKDAFYSDLESVVDDIELLIKDYGYNIEECLEDEEECQSADDNLFKVISAYSQLKLVLEEVL